MNYATLTQCKRICGLDTTDTADDALIQRYMTAADAWIEKVAQRSFKPIIETRLFDWQDSYELYFQDDLLEALVITNGDSVAVALADIVYCPRRLYPKYGIEIIPTSSTPWIYSNSPENSLSVKGVWGCHNDYANAWVASQDAVADGAGINASVTTVTVTSITGAAADAETPRFQVGQLIKIESEYMSVLATTDSTTKTLTVVRAAQGSTAATHANGKTISIFRPQVADAAMEYVHWRYLQKNSRADYGSEIPKDILDLVPTPSGAHW